MPSELRSLLKKATATFGVLLLFAAVLLPAMSTKVSAVGAQVQSRSIKMSSAQTGAAAIYDVSFTLASTYTIKGMILDFCSGSGSTVSSPIIGDNCVAPAGFSVGSTPTVTKQGSPTVDVTGWTASALNSNRTLSLTNATGTPVAVGNTVHFTLDTATNPTDRGTFYARILTYSTTTISTYNGGSEGSYQDYGGFALSTNYAIPITAKVQETLTFCVSGTDVSGTADPAKIACSDATAPTLTLGHGTPVATLDNSAVDTSTAYTQISTNASAGAVVRMRNLNTCSNGGLSSNGGSACNINGMAAVGTTDPGDGPSGIAPGVTDFGAYVSSGATTVGVPTSSGNYNPDANYHDTTVSSTHTNETSPTDLWFGMDQSTTNGVGTTYGDVIATTAGAPCSRLNNHIVFGATAGLTVPAGVYTATMDIIATGTF